MPKDTPSMAKNKMRRSLGAIFDPHPSKTEIDSLWRYFESRCAYCGTPIKRESRTGHVDHLIPSSDGGGNNIHNHALACARCNGDEKREESWQSFLERKAEGEQTYQERKEKINNWLALSPPNKINTETVAKAQEITEEAIAAFEHAVEKMRELRKNGT